ncbi:hypothetical protein Q4Q39_19225 [Flavivirga amylovorans]|uniref:Uncharacterized protein n=1 Tax=Flavivirga amylovorans TaxID=870486 RepID=A0ABT8X785_9FLAO|nr:hypothetical protein [Flavivirga amylovorans]MDO5989542.1 hypothetical protein [Flavivirga amylovorans]
MKYRILTHKKTSKKHIVFDDEEFEMKNPIKQYENDIIAKQMILNGVSKEEMTGEKELTTTSNEILKSAHIQWLKLKSDFQKIKVPENLMQLLKTDKKKDQEKLLDGFFLPLETLTSFIFTAYHEFGYTLSQYISEFSKKDFKSVARIIDCGEHWHCFFTTPKDSTGEKTQLHYLSSAFGIKRDDLVKQIKSNESLSKLDNLPLITL